MNEKNYQVGASPYDQAYVLRYPNGDVSLETPDPQVILSPGDKIHTFMDGDTLQNIAFRYYGDSGYWYRIAEANGIINPFDNEELYIGKRLIIPIYGSI